MYFLFQIFSFVLACNDQTVCIFFHGRNVRGRNVRGRNVLAKTSVDEMSVDEMSEHRLGGGGPHIQLYAESQLFGSLVRAYVLSTRIFWFHPLGY